MSQATGKDTYTLFDGFIDNRCSYFTTCVIYRKILIISPGLIFVQKAFLLGLFSGSFFSEGLVTGFKEFCILKWVWLVNKNT